jgi:predicted ATPase
MFTRIKLENFKSWQSLDIELAPLTLLFGTNSSGKSSVVQAILLLVQSMEKHTLNEIDFGGKPSDYVNLGSYKDIVYNHDLLKEIKIHLDYDWEHQNGIRKMNHGVNIRYIDDEVQHEEIHDGDILFDLIHNQNAIHYLAPLRQYPQRSYLWSGAAPTKILPDGENTIAALVESDRRDKRIVKQVAEWLVKMELVNKFRVAPLDAGKRFYETLVDVGGVETALLDTGFGISQVLPVVTTLFFAPEDSTILIEQPELHLHPRAQAHLADLLLYVAEHRKLQLIIESHSEHLLRRLQRRIAEHENEYASPENVRMYFCDTGENGSTIQSVDVDEYGQIKNWPDKFFGDITGDLEAMTMAALKRSMNGKN